MSTNNNNHNRDKVKTYLLAASGRRTIRNTPWIDDVPTESFTLPKYEVEILDKVKRENTVVCLHSTTSKNFLIVTIMREFSSGIERNLDKNGQRIVCLSMEQDPVALAEMIHRHLPVDVGSFGIEHGVLLWKKEQWLQETQIRSIFVMHPTVFNELLNRNYLEFSHIKLLILDECHQAIRDHSYGSILKQYKSLWEKKDENIRLPRLFSLTTALLKTHCTPIQLEERLENLRDFFSSNVFTASDLICRQSNRPSKIPKETIIVCEKDNDQQQQPDITVEIIRELNEALDYLNQLEPSSNCSPSDENPSPLTIPRQVLTECLRLIHRLGIWALLRSSLPIITQLERLSSIAVEESANLPSTNDVSLSSARAYSLFLDWTCTLLRLWRSRIKTVLETVDSQTLIEKYTTSKLRSLFEILKRFQAEATNPNTRRWSAILFVDRKQETAVLNAILKDAAKRFASEYSFIRPNFLIGYSNMQSTDDLASSQHIQPMDSRKQEEVMRKFRMGENNLIVALSSLEELKDIPDCNLVIRFDVPTNYRSYIQSKGKARAQQPNFFMLVQRDEYDEFLNNLNSFKGIEQVLSKDFQELNNPAPLPSTNSTERSPNAIEVINRYCARLPCDALTTLVPSCEVKKLASNQYQCILSLPVNSPARTTIYGPIRSTIKQAKLSSAKRLCEHLLQAGELNEYLLPETREQFYLRHSIIDDDDINEWGSYVEPNPKPGSVQRKQLYTKATIPEINSTSHSSDFFLYAIKGELTTPLIQTNDQQKSSIFYSNQANSYRIGVLSANYLLEIPAFSLFSRAGEETYHLELIDKNQHFTSDEYRMLQTVHYYIFSSILGFDRPLVNFNPEKTQSHLNIVLLKQNSNNQSFTIDWQLTKDIISFIQSMYLQKYSFDDPYIFNANDFNQTCIVLPSYRRSTQPQYYIVNSIDTTKNPLSSFPSVSTIYNTFSSYYEIKYELKLTNKTQPLLCVSHTSHRMNQLIPRYMNFKLMKSTNANRNSNRTNQHTKPNGSAHHHQGVFLIPELVIIHPINAHLWQGLIALPSMLYRIHCLILVEQLRRTVALETGVGAAWAPDEGLFDKLGFDWDEKKEAQFSALLDNNDIFLTDEPIDPNWNFEISVWNENEMHSWTNDAAWLEAKDRCIMINAADFEDADFDDDLDFDEDLPVPQSLSKERPILNWPANSSQTKVNNHSLSTDDDDDDDDDDDEDDAVNDEKQSAKISLTESKVANYHIDLPRLHEDLKAKSKKFLSKLMANTEPTNDSKKQNDIDLFSTIDDLPIKTNMKIESSNYLTNVQIEQPKQIVQPSSSPSVIHFEPTPMIKRLLNIEDVINDDGEEEEEQQQQQKETKSPPSGQSQPTFLPRDNLIYKIENGHDSGIIDDFTDPLNINLDFEYLPESHPGPSPALLLQALTLSNAGDGFDLERLETVGDSFLKQAVTVYIYCTYTNVHEGKLSFFRSKIVSNYNLYKLGKRKLLGEYLISTKFEPFENWIPPLFTSGSPTEYGILSSSGVELWTKSESTTNVDWIELLERREQKKLAKANLQSTPTDQTKHLPPPLSTFSSITMINNNQPTPGSNDPQWTPSYDRRTQHLISDKSIADAVEALIGAYLIASGPKAALRFMAWLGVRIFPKLRLEDGTEMTGELPPLPSPVDYSNPTVLSTIDAYNFDRFEQLIGYRFHQRAYLIQAFTHASYSYNTITDCYQRLEFLGDAVLDYVITRYLYEHPKRHSPGELTDLRSALVNNNIFAYIAVKYDFHKYFRCHSNELFLLIDKFVQTQKDKSSWYGFDECNLGDDDDENDEFFYYDFLTSSASNNKDAYSSTIPCAIDDEQQLSNSHDEQDDDPTTTHESDEWEETEVPKCLGDIFESVAGAIFLDSNKSFNTVWKIYYRMLKPFIEKFTTKVPKSPIRELLELEPETVKFEKPERLLDGRIRVTVEIIGKGRFKGVGRNYRIAKNAAAKCALKNLRRLD